MIDVVRVHQLIHRIQIAFVYLVVKPTYKSLVSFGRHGSLPSCEQGFPRVEITPAPRREDPTERARRNPLLRCRR
jgi:hypothetical protein